MVRAEASGLCGRAWGSSWSWGRRGFVARFGARAGEWAQVGLAGVGGVCAVDRGVRRRVWREPKGLGVFGRAWVLPVEQEELQTVLGCDIGAAEAFGGVRGDRCRIA